MICDIGLYKQKKINTRDGGEILFKKNLYGIVGWVINKRYYSDNKYKKGSSNVWGYVETIPENTFC